MREGGGRQGRELRGCTGRRQSGARSKSGPREGPNQVRLTDRGTKFTSKSLQIQVPVWRPLKSLPKNRSGKWREVCAAFLEKQICWLQRRHKQPGERAWLELDSSPRRLTEKTFWGKAHPRRVSPESCCETLNRTSEGMPEAQAKQSSLLLPLVPHTHPASKLERRVVAFCFPRMQKADVPKFVASTLLVRLL